MKLNYDCIRSVLFALEEHIDIDDDLRIVYVSVESLFEQLPKYENKDILYTVEKLTEAGYIKSSIQYAGRMFNDGVIEGITYRGHEFLESIRDNKIWGNVKRALSNVGTMSLPLILETAKGLAMNALADVIKIGK